MKLKIYDLKTTSHRSKTKIPAVTFSADGTITFNAAACYALSLDANSRVVFSQDQNNPGDWYVGRGNEGFLLRKYKGRCHRLSSQYIVNMYNKSIGNEKPVTARHILATEPIQDTSTFWYAIITSSLI